MEMVIRNKELTSKVTQLLNKGAGLKDVSGIQKTLHFALGHTAFNERSVHITERLGVVLRDRRRLKSPNKTSSSNERSVRKRMIMAGKLNGRRR